MNWARGWGDELDGVVPPGVAKKVGREDDGEKGVGALSQSAGGALAVLSLYVNVHLDIDC